jgi:hypothetical protein
MTTPCAAADPFEVVLVFLSGTGWQRFTRHGQALDFGRKPVFFLSHGEFVFSYERCSMKYA